MSQVTQKELIRQVQSNLETDYGYTLSLDKIRAVLNAHGATVADQLVSGKEVRIASVGLLELRDFKATTGRNLQTGETINIPATKRVKFRPIPTVKKAVKQLAVAS